MSCSSHCKVSLVAVFFLTLMGCASAQEDLFLPSWSIGESKMATIVEHLHTVENDSVTVDTSKTVHALIEVIAASANNYTLRIRLDNQAVLTALHYFPDLKEELRSIETYDLEYQFDRNTGVRTISNFDSVQASVRSSLQLIDMLTDGRDANKALQVAIYNSELKTAVKNTSNADAYYKGLLDDIFVLYAKPLQSDLPYVVNENCSLLNLGISDLTVKHIFLITNIEQSIITIKKDATYDLSAFLERLEQIQSELSELNFQGANADLESITNFGAEISGASEYLFDSESGWPTHIQSEFEANITTSLGHTSTTKSVNISLQ